MKRGSVHQFITDGYGSIVLMNKNEPHIKGHDDRDYDENDDSNFDVRFSLIMIGSVQWKEHTQNILSLLQSQQYQPKCESNAYHSRPRCTLSRVHGSWSSKLYIVSIRIPVPRIPRHQSKPLPALDKRSPVNTQNVGRVRYDLRPWNRIITRDKSNGSLVTLHLCRDR